MNILKRWLRAWLEVPPPGAELESLVREFRAEADALREQMRTAAAAASEPSKDALAELSEFRRELQRARGTLLVAANDGDNALHRMLFAEQKVDALAEVLGIVVAPPPIGISDPEVTIAPAKAMEREHAGRMAEAELMVRDLRRMRVTGERSLQGIKDAEREAERRLREPKK